MSIPTLALVQGPEEILAERGVESVVDAVRAAEPEAEVVRLYAASYQPGELGVHASPSLFGGWTVIVVHDMDEADDALVEDLLAYLARPEESVTLVVRHKSGNRGKKVLDTLRAGGARTIEAKAVRSEADKHAFVKHEFREARRRIAEDAVGALVQAVGKDLRELAGACAQLARDVQGTVEVEDVHTYYGERVETTGFKVAEAALAGDEAGAMSLLRHAMNGGLDPVPLVAVLAMQLRQVGRVAAAGRGSSTQVARDLGIAPWQVDQARRVARGWDGPRLGRAVEAVARADVDVKGGLRTEAAVRAPEYAVERAVLQVCRARHGEDG
ncbi:DNA polymerase III subunit delta [Ornithinimicrobium sp. CNJ-824]|uniref:DNA polymerase III subunit delta n=1 Tax=Ornithinimicrobium sp. CNJ-824 TaxID=1904966 RepID=UPI000964BB50|nr:DNA polymerase III subunit delta [Ornithinimicrobium sp. CNJ-824]OLT20255.1 DNA polymerase III subunit delta [Ornithinimicrobium sp. CNJ-824]